MKQDLYDYLNGTPGVTAVFADAGSPTLVRIYPQILPQRPTYPAATYQLVGRQRQGLLNATTGSLKRSSVSVDVYAKTSEDVKTGSDAISAALLDFRGQMGSTHVNRVALDNEIDLTDVEPGLFRNSMSFTIWHD